MVGYSVRQFDAIIVGAGGAGMRAALQLAQTGKHNVAVLSKVFPTRSHTVSAQGGISAALGNKMEDNWHWHMYDTVMGSDFLGDQAAIEYMCQEAPKTVYELEHMGLPFSRQEDGRIYQRGFGGHTQEFGKRSVARACAAADRTGHALVHTLYQKNLEAGTNFFNEWYVLDLLKTADGSAVAGVLALEIETGDLCMFTAKAVVLATGGAGQVYNTTSNAYINTGDGLGMAFRAGFPLEDMEFWQFHPTGVYGVGCLISEACRGEGGYLVNGEGERFMERYSPTLKDLDCRDKISRAEYKEIKAGRGCGPKKDHVHLILHHLDAEIIQKRLPGIRELSIKFSGVDPVTDPIPVCPTNHYMMGGIPTHIDGNVYTYDAAGKERRIDGLYAAGECACVSVHGANRLGTNSLLDIVVYGRAVGIALDTRMDHAHFQTPDSAEIERAMGRYNRWFRDDNTESAYDIKREMRAVMEADFGVYRTQDQMDSGLKKINELENRMKKASLADHSKQFNTTFVEMCELENMMEVARSTALCASAREESRGAHSRVDFPKRDDVNWLAHSLVMSDGTFHKKPVDFKPKHVKPFELEERTQ